MQSLFNYISEAISSGKFSSGNERKLGQDDICEWFKSLGLPNTDLRKNHPGYEMYVDDDTGKILVRAKIFVGSKRYVVDTWYRTPTDQIPFSMRFYKGLVGAPYLIDSGDDTITISKLMDYIENTIRK